MTEGSGGAFVALPSLTSDHDCSQFTSGAEDLDEWLKERALKSKQAGNAATFVATAGGSRVVAYYALAATAVTNDRDLVPGAVRRQAPRDIPCLLLARLAVDQEFQGRRLGSRLFQDALWRSTRVAEDVGFRALLVHARDDEAAASYSRMAPPFRPSPSDPMHLFLPLSSLLKLRSR